MGKDAWVGSNHLTPNEVYLFSGGVHLDNKVDSQTRKLQSSPEFYIYISFCSHVVITDAMNTGSCQHKIDTHMLVMCDTFFWTSGCKANNIPVKVCG